MKPILSRLCILVLIFSANTFFAATYYVSKTGNDSNNGSIDAPFATFSKAVSAMSAGDICIIRGGVYDEELVIDKNGSAGNYLTFKAADGEDVELKATSKLNGWSLHSGDIYKSNVNMSIASRFRAVYHNGNYQDLARWPNNTDDNRWTVDCAPLKGGDGSHFLVNNIPNIDWTGGLVYYLATHSGTSWTRKITASSSNRIDYTSVDIAKWPFSNHNPTWTEGKTVNKHGQLFLFNKLEALDSAREWYYDDTSDILYLQTADGNMPANGSVEYATRQYTAQLQGNYIKLEGINFYGGAIKIHNKADNNQIIDCTIIHGNEGHDSLTNKGAQVGEASIEVLGDNTLIKGCTINHSAVNGINIQGWAASNCTIEGNTISNIDYVGIHASPIRTSGDAMKILKNTIFNAGRDGMFVAGQNCEIAYNDVSVSQIINSDSGVFYTVGNDEPKNNVLHHNWFHDATAPAYSHNPGKAAKAAGIYLDNDSKGWTVHHNVVWNVSWNGYQVNWNNVGLDFYHNTIWDAHNAMDSWDINGPQLNNKVYNNYANTGTWFTGNGPSEFDIKDSPIFAASPFEDADNQNFMPVAGSALVDVAPVIPGFEKSFVGSAADIGAYERGGTAWTAGVNAIEDTGTATTAPIEPTITITSQPTSIYFNDFSSPSELLSNNDFKLRIDGLDPAETYNLFSRIKNETTDVEIIFFNKQGITGVTSTTIDLNWTNFPNNPVVINATDKFTLINKLFSPTIGGLQAESDVFEIALDSALSNEDFILENVNSLSIYPNPTEGTISITGIDEDSAFYTIYDTVGKKLRDSKDFEGLENGIYFLIIKTTDINIIRKVVVEK